MIFRDTFLPQPSSNSVILCESKMLWKRVVYINFFNFIITVFLSVSLNHLGWRRPQRSSRSNPSALGVCALLLPVASCCTVTLWNTLCSSSLNFLNCRMWPFPMDITSDTDEVYSFATASSHSQPLGISYPPHLHQTKQCLSPQPFLRGLEAAHPLPLPSIEAADAGVWPMDQAHTF